MAEVKDELQPHNPSMQRIPIWRRRSTVTWILLVAILGMGALFRLTGLNWDQDRHLHPDERYMTVLASMLRSVPSASEYFDSAKSTMNPFNTDWGHSYVYGTLPLFAGRYIAEFMDYGCGPNALTVPRYLGQLFFGSDVNGCHKGTFTGYDYMALLGRMWSSLTDLIAIFFLFLISRRLFGHRVALLAAAFSSAAVLQIQLSHFFTVDSTANLFVITTLWFCILITTGKGKWSLKRESALWAYSIGAGLSAGFGIASKISVWPLVPMIIISLAVMLLRDKRRSMGPFYSAAIALVLAGIFTFASFRVAQPYAFVGNSQAEFELTIERCNAEGARDILSRVCALGASLPKPVREIFAPSARWIEQLNLAQGFVNGTIDAPFGHQWANRTPIVFPLTNIVFWGLGVPLGLATIIGFLYALSRLLRGKRWWAYLLPVTWAGTYFLYQSTQWTKSMRYLLPIYPFLCLFAAIALVALWRNASRITAFAGSTWQRLKVGSHRVLSTALPVLVLAGTVAWALAFMQIYSQPITRVTASRWVYENVPTAVTILWSSSDGNVLQQQLPIKAVSLEQGSSITFPLTPEKTVPVNTLDVTAVLNHITGAGQIEIRVLSEDGQRTITTVKSDVDEAHPQVHLGAVSVISATRYLLSFRLLSGQSVYARTSTVANEHWDDAVPQPLDGKDAYSSYYNGLESSSDGQIQNYAEDTPEKLPQVLSWLDEADYLVLSSNRLYASIPRLPWRFPMTTEYYRALLGGELGFELVADFNSFPRIGSLVFNDQEMPQILQRSAAAAGTAPGVAVPYPTAEEAFSVYDHPRVLIFKKKSSYSNALASQVLGKYALTRTIKQTPLQAVNTPRGMLFDEQTRLAQSSGGTWSELFPRSSPLNQSQPLAVIAWLLLNETLGIAVFPVIAVVTSRLKGGEWRLTLADGGFSFSKILALLLVAVTTWWLASTKLAPFTWLSIWIIIAMVIVSGALVWWRYHVELRALLQERTVLILVSELLFITAFLVFLLIRIGNPDLWHPYMGGEKPMDFAYLNGVLKSTYFPPMDPWFANGYINYYYFGFVVIGTPIKALGIDPAIAYNLVVPLLFGLTATGAFGIAATLYLRIGTKPMGSPSSTRVSRAIIAGLLAALFVVGLGNLRELDTIIPAWQKLGNIQGGANSVGATLNGIGKWLSGSPLAIYPNWPYWNPTRPTAGLPVDAVQIAEFPLFTFLYADLHAHMMAMPIAFLALAFALAYSSGAWKWPAILLGSLTAGALWPTNSWDYPVYLVICVTGIVINVLHTRLLKDKYSWGRSLLSAVPAAIVFILLTRILFIPYLENYGAAYNSIEAWKNERTPLDIYLSLFGLLILPVASYLATALYVNTHNNPRRIIGGLVFLTLTAIVTVLIMLQGIAIALVAVPLAAMAYLAALMPNTPSQTRILWLMTSGAFVLTLFVELFTLKGDIGRMNTVFKFYIQTWLILGVTSAVLLVWTWERLASPANLKAAQNALKFVLRPAFALAVLLLVGLAFAYPAFAVPAKIRDRYTANAPRGLDGMAYMTVTERYESKGDKSSTFPLMDDYQAIKWMQDHVQGSPVIIEGTTGGDLYRWGNRFSIYTGLPSVIGWQWHQRQQRAALKDKIVYDRDDDLKLFYDTNDISTALTIIRRYRAKYIIVGALERVYYSQSGLPKFTEMTHNGFLREAFTHGGTTIYEVDAVY